MSNPGWKDPLKLYTIPYQDKFLIYRPLRKLAFIGNGAMANLCDELSKKSPEAARSDDEATRFLEAAGFFEPDAPPSGDGGDPLGYRPTVCVLFLTQRCNLRCVYCYAHGGDGGKAPDMDPELARLAIGEACRNAVESGRAGFEVCFHGGGEPTEAWSLLKSAVEHARRAPLKATINLTSNGAWTPSKRSWIMANIDQVSLSFDGLPEVQNSQRPKKSGEGSHALVWRAIKALDAARLPYGIRLTVTDQFVSRLPENIRHLCDETGAGGFQVEPAFAQGRGKSDKMALKRQAKFAQYFMEAYDMAAERKRHMYYSGARPWLITSRFCEAHHSALVVGHDGFLAFCYEVCGRDHELAGDFIFGQLGEGGGAVIDEGKRRSFLEKIERRREGCQSCFCFYHCAGDCPAKTFSKASGELSRSARCWLNRELTKSLLVRYVEAGGGLWMGEAGPRQEMAAP